MGEKGNITSDELAAAGGGAVMAGAGTQVTAVFQDVGDSLKGKIIDKGTDAGISVAQEKWQSRREDGKSGEDEQQDPPSS